MKNSIYLLLVLVVFVLVGCTSKPRNYKDTQLAGIWQNANNASIAVEFTKNGDYHLRFQGERISATSTGETVIEKFTYDTLSSSPNLKIFDSKKSDTTRGELVFINPNRIKISILFHDTIVSEAEFFKIII
jgi:hypothetical protein